MTNVSEILCAIERQADRAIVQELRLMIQQILTLRTSLVLEERSQADALLLKLDRLATDLVATPAVPGIASEPLWPELTLADHHEPEDQSYQACFYDAECGDLDQVIPVDSFETGVQLVIDRLQSASNYEAEASWSGNYGQMKVSSLGGTVLASVDTTRSPKVTVHINVLRACHALRAGDTSRIGHLFGQALMAA